MEHEHSKATNDHVTKGVVNRDFSPPSSPSSSCSSTLDFDIDEKGSFEPPSATSPSTQSPQWVMSSGSQPAREMESPPLQTMQVHPPGYDPNRIPASVFSASPAEWSVTSNESLFSIHMGNNSFSRDHEILFGKSGEFPRLDDWNTELSSLPPVMEQEESSVRSRKDSVDHTDNAPKVVAPARVEMESDHVKPDQQVSPVVVTNMPHVRNASNPRVSDVSGHSGHSGSSFAFPLLLGEGGKSNGSLKIAKEPEKMQKPAELQAHVSYKASIPDPNKPKASEEKCRCWPGWSCFPRCC